MREDKIFEKMEMTLQNRVVSEHDLYLFEFVLHKLMEARVRKMHKTGQYNYIIDFHETRLALLSYTIKKFLAVCESPYPSIVIESEEINHFPENKPAGSLYLHDIGWLQVLSYLFLKDKALYSGVSKHWYKLIHSSAVCEDAVPFIREDKQSWYILPVRKMRNHWDLVLMSEPPTPERIRKYFFQGNLAFVRYEKQLFCISNANTTPYLDQVRVNEKTITTFDSLTELHNLSINQVVSLNSLSYIKKITIAALLKMEYQEERAPTVNEFRQSLKEKSPLSKTHETVGQMVLFNPQGRVLEFVGNRKYYFTYKKKIDRLSKFETFLAILFGAWLLAYTTFQKPLENWIDGPLPVWGGNLILLPIGMFLLVSYFKNGLIDSAFNDHALNSSLNRYASNELIYSFFPEIQRNRKNWPVDDLKSEKSRGFKKD
jgi:hypothetical protein